MGLMDASLVDNGEQLFHRSWALRIARALA